MSMSRSGADGGPNHGRWDSSNLGQDSSSCVPGSQQGKVGSRGGCGRRPSYGLPDALKLSGGLQACSRSLGGDEGQPQSPRPAQAPCPPPSASASERMELPFTALVSLTLVQCPQTGVSIRQWYSRRESFLVSKSN